MMHRSISGTATQTSLTDQQKELEYQIKKYQKKIEILEGKLRGFATIGDLLRDSKAEYEQLKVAKNHLEVKLADLSLFDDPYSKATVLGISRDLEEPACKKEKRVNDNKLTMENKDLNMSKASIHITSDPIVSTPAAMANPVGYTLWNSRMHTAPNDDIKWSSTMLPQEKIHVLDTIKGKPSSPAVSENNTRLQGEAYPVQESMILDEIENHFGVRNVGVGLNNPPNHRNINGNMDDTSDIAQGSVHVKSESREKSLKNLIDFPSLQSSNGQESESSNYQAAGNEECLSIQLGKLADSVNMAARDKSITGSFSRLKREIKTLEDDVNKYKKMIDNLLGQNNVVNVQLKEALTSESRLKEERRRLIEKIQQVEHDRDNLSTSGSLSSQTQVVGWVNVTKTGARSIDIKEDPIVGMEKNQTKDNGAASDMLRKMEKLNALNNQLIDANQKWSAEWGKLQVDAEKKISYHRQDAERLTKEMTEMKMKHDAKICELEQVLSSSKQHHLEEESAKEDLQDQVAELSERQQKYQIQIEELEKANVNISQEKQALEAELIVLRSQASIRVMATLPVHSGSGPESTQTDIAVLREQITLFQEDFEKERQDRARAQSAKDILSSKNETLLKKIKSLETKMKDLERQMKSAETNVNQTLNQNQTLQQENSSLKNKLRMERETRTVPVVTQYYPPGVQTAGYQQPPASQNVNYQAPYVPQQYVGQPNPRPMFLTNQSQNPPELLPGAWKCLSCTYVNFPTRTVCEICGFFRNSVLTNGSVSPNQQQLYTRGEADQQVNNYQPHFGISERPGDLQTDDGLNLKT